MSEPKKTVQWSSGFAFVIAAASTAIGLGNLWRFPFLVGQYGGGAFIIVYLGVVIFICLPIIIAELAIGRRGCGSPAESVRRLSSSERAGGFWRRTIGPLSLIIPFVGIGYYSVVAGWVTDYMAVFIASGGFPKGPPEAFSQRYEDMLASPWRLLAGHTAFMTGVVAVAAFGVRKGLEGSSKALLPLLFLILVGLAFYGCLQDDFSRAARFLFAPDFSKLGVEGFVAAIGQAFFSLTIGLGALMTFGAYLPKQVSILRCAAGLCAADTSASLLAGLAIFPIAFALGIDPASGPGLVFVTMPAAFASIPGGYFIGSAFFILVFLAAFTTGVGTIEPVVAWVERRGFGRAPAAILSGLGAWMIGAAALLSFNVWSEMRPLGFISPFTDKSIFDLLDMAIATILLPLNGLLAALFAGWAVASLAMKEEIRPGPVLFAGWRFCIRFVAPTAVIAILVAPWIWKE
jgi:NSS family neurotransmitter:Na+ symporter